MLRLLISFTFCMYFIPVSAHTFSFSSGKFIEMYNIFQKTQEGDTLEKCTKSEDTTTCKFTKHSFDGAIEAMKKLNLINGNFVDKATVTITEEKGSVSMIIISGDRADPVNLFQTIGRVSGLLSALGMPDSDGKRLLLDLGLMRGDDDPTIGKPVVSIENYAAIKCNNQHSDISTIFGCVIVPRN